MKDVSNYQGVDNDEEHDLDASHQAQHHQQQNSSNTTRTIPVVTSNPLLSLFDPPPQLQQQKIHQGSLSPQEQQLLGTNHSDSEHVPLIQQQQHYPSIFLNETDNDYNDNNSNQQTPKQRRTPYPRTFVAEASNNNNDNDDMEVDVNHNRNDSMEIIDSRSRNGSYTDILPSINEALSYTSDASITPTNSDIIGIPPTSSPQQHTSTFTEKQQPLTPTSAWLQYGSINDNNTIESTKSRQQQQQQFLMSPSLLNTNCNNDPLSQGIQQQPLLKMNHYNPNKNATGSTNQSTSTTTTLSWIKSSLLPHIVTDLTSPSTYIGAFLFLLFELVFSLTIGATITRRSSSGSSSSILGLVTKMAALGTIFGGPIYWFNLRDVPALYPVVDLFAAPFLANIATIIDDTLYNDPIVRNNVDNDEIFLTTFTFLASLSLFMSGSFMVLASVFRLANLGSFLPFPVLCGFFTAAACMTWTLAFKVDTNGLTVSHVFLSGDIRMIINSLVHHIPSILVGATMKYGGPKHPLFVLSSVIITIGMFYTTMFVFGVSFQEMMDMHWFWSEQDLKYQPPVGSSLPLWSAPAPFGWIHSTVNGKIHWGAVINGIETTVALAFLYMIRCSIHGTALKKNISTLSRVEKIKVDQPVPAASIKPLSLERRPTVVRSHKRKFSEAVDIDETQTGLVAPVDVTATTVVTAKPTRASLKVILNQYGYSQIISGLAGGFAVIPCVATAPTMFMLGAEKLAPQLGAALLLLVFYFTDFALVQFIPKTAFSSLLLLSSIDMLSFWCIQSYFKTEQKLEWFVVPLIVVLAFAFGLLQSVFLGIAISTFIFVASFFRSGVVKFIANGMHVRSTIERPPHVSKWLDKSAAKIQILVLQNYLFFGNASSMIAYITMMFDEPETSCNSSAIIPCPVVVIIDMTLVTGMDTSAVDAFKDILTVCTNNDCKLFLSGVSPNLQKVMKLVGVHPSSNIVIRSQRKLRFFIDLDTAIGKAEDVLIEFASFEEEIALPFEVQKRDGFYKALYHIDVQHETKFATDLSDLRDFSTVLDLVPGDELYEENNDERGLFFIEHGILKMERLASNTMSRVGNTYSAMNTFRGSVSRFIGSLTSQAEPRFRLARICPGWVIGNLEALAGAKPGHIVAVTNCRLHYISYEKVAELEVINPVLVLKLYKLLSHLMTKRQEITIAQLATLHAIMGSPACKKPIGRTLSISG